MIYNVCSIEVAPAQHNAALSGLEDALGAGRIAGELRGCWYCEIGRLNRVLAVFAYASGEALAVDRDTILRSADPFGVSAIARSISLDAYATFPGVEFLAPGTHGPVYEIREYRLKRAGLAPTFAAWSKVLDARRKVSPLASVMYALDGVVPRFMHVWPFASLDERTRLRAEAVSRGVWPPPGGLEHIEAMQSEIFLPAAFSPLR